ncbi:MAG: hypothetical protein ACI9Y1_002112 [Lentisphaeria bacterium]|jgi:uncharacterized protein YbaR (Trm112 family)
MSLPSELCELLACPSTGQPLQLTGNQLSIADSDNSYSDIAYPLISGVPWLLPNPANSLMDWGGKLNHFNQVIMQEIQSLERELKHASGATAQRLQKLHTAKQIFLRRVCELLIPVLAASAGAQPSNKAAYDALRDRAPTTQNLLSYEANLYRDWVWGEKENRLTADLVLKHARGVNTEKLIVLGAGAGRLALDIHTALQPKVTVATDINPLLVLAAQHILSESDISISEFPLHPRNSECVAVEHTIKGVKKPHNFHFIFCDASNPAFLRGAFDTVVTPWFIDIQPLEFGRFLRQLNHYIPVGGHWINFGSLVFNQNRDALCYAIDEVQEIAEQQGFTLTDIQQHEIPYLKSPYNAGYRMEHVWSWAAQKHAEVKALNTPQTLPSWALDNTQSIPKALYYQQFSLTHRIYAQLAAEVDGGTSLVKIANKLAKQQQMNPEEALHLVKNFFVDLHQQNQ